MYFLKSETEEKRYKDQDMWRSCPLIKNERREKNFKILTRHIMTICFHKVSCIMSKQRMSFVKSPS